MLLHLLWFPWILPFPLYIVIFDAAQNRPAVPYILYMWLSVTLERSFWLRSFFFEIKQHLNPWSGRRGMMSRRSRSFLSFIKYTPLPLQVFIFVFNLSIQAVRGYDDQDFVSPLLGGGRMLIDTKNGFGEPLNVMSCAPTRTSLIINYFSYT